MSDGHYDAPAYCALCGIPIATGPYCEPCLNPPDEASDWGDGLDDVFVDPRETCSHPDITLETAHPGGDVYAVCQDCNQSWPNRTKDIAI